MRDISYRVALGGIVSALCLVTMFLAGVIPALYLLLPGIAGILLMIIAVEVNIPWAFLTYMLAHPFTEDQIPSNLNLEVDDPFVAELLSYGVEPLSPIVGNATFSNIRNSIELDGQQFFLTYVMEPDDDKAQALVDDWNAKWAAERANWVN